MSFDIALFVGVNNYPTSACVFHEYASVYEVKPRHNHYIILLAFILLSLLSKLYIQLYSAETNNKSDNVEKKKPAIFVSSLPPT